MKKINIIVLLCLLCFCSCNKKTNNGNKNSQLSQNLSAVEGIKYDDINTVQNLNEYASEVKKNAINNDDPVNNGIVNCTFYSLRVNDTIIPIYTTRCALDLHSFAWIDILENKNINLNIELTLNNSHKNVTVLPEKNNVCASLDGNLVKANITSCGIYTFVFDKKPSEALTLYIDKKEELNVLDGYQIQEFTPGDYKISDTSFKNQNTVYYFKRGRYKISSISLPSNSILYFERGTYVDVITETENDRTAAIRSSSTSNIRICGRALFDFSRNQGGTAGFQGKGMYGFSGVSNVYFGGIITINSSAWTLCFTNSDHVEIEKCMIFGYRTCSDGVMLSDCQDSTVRYCFVRTGDDAIEAKSTGSEGTRNLVYEYNDVWTDKARGYGCIYESNKDMDGVYFRHNTIGFSQPTWSPDLGCLIVKMGNRQQTTWKNIFFEDFEIYNSSNAIANISLGDGSGEENDGGIAKNIYFKDIKVRRGYSFALRVDVQRGSQLGIIYLNNFSFNNEVIKEATLNDSNIINVVHYNSAWSMSKNIKIS